MMTVGFVLVGDGRAPDAAAIVARAAELGVGLAHRPEDGKDGVHMFDFDGGFVGVTVIDAPHPDAVEMGVGPLSPPRDAVAAAKGHVIVAISGPEQPARVGDVFALRVLAAVTAGFDALAAMLGHGAVFHRADALGDLVESELPCEVMVDVTAAQESATRMSFLTHNMPRYGREDLYVTCRIEGQGALDFVYAILRWMLVDPDKQFPTGDTIGRTPDEKIRVQRVESPIDAAAQVVRLDLP